MKRMIHLVLVAALFAGMLLVSGCDPVKPGGGGYDQPYDSNNGQYK